MKVIKIVISTVFLAQSYIISGQNQATDRPPNIILILADDMGYSDIGAFGSEIDTPNLDKLAEEGIRFTHLYNTGKCFPSRASLLTGAYAQQVGMGSEPGEIENAVTLGEMLRTAGYRTLWSGKHHGTQNPVTLGFDRYYGLRDGASNHFNPGLQRPGEGKPAQKRDNRAWIKDGQLYQPYTPEFADFYTTDYFTNYPLKWLEEYKNENKPFFIYLSYTAPHDPLMAWPEHIAKYEGKYMGGYEAVRRERLQRQKAMALVDDELQLPEPQHTNWEDLSEAEKEKEDLKMAVYAAMIDRLDQNVGRLIEKLKELGEEENTLILFASDNGASAEVVHLEGSGAIGTMTRWTSLGADWANASNTPLRFFKNYSHEGGIRTPLIAYWPAGIKGKGRISDIPLHFIDFMPTFLELTGLTYPQERDGEPLVPLQGISFLPILEGGEVERGKPLYWQWAKGRAVREGDWKLVSWDGSWELYNLEKDPTEQNNLVDKFPKKTRRLIEKYTDWARKVKVNKN